jgi:hypothetical protein
MFASQFQCVFVKQHPSKCRSKCDVQTNDTVIITHHPSFVSMHLAILRRAKICSVKENILLGEFSFIFGLYLWLNGAFLQSTTLLHMSEFMLSGAIKIRSSQGGLFGVKCPRTGLDTKSVQLNAAGNYKCCIPKR